MLLRRLLLIAACLSALPLHAQTTKILGRKVVAPFCGDGILNGSEVCDGSALGSGTCVNQGFSLGGTLACKQDGSCTYDTSGCFASCALPIGFSNDPSPCFNIDSGSTRFAWTGLSEAWSHGYAVDSLRWTATTMGSADQHAEIKIASISRVCQGGDNIGQSCTVAAQATDCPGAGGGVCGGVACGGVILRAGATSTTARYVVCARVDSSRVRWVYVDTAGAPHTIEYSAACGTWEDGDVLNATVSGTGTSTQVVVKENGTIRCTLTGSGLGCDPTNVRGNWCVDSGAYVGFGADGNDGTGSFTFDDFDAGTP